VLTSNHGAEFQEHGGWWHGGTLYEEQIWIPLVVRYPRGFEYADGTVAEPEIETEAETEIETEPSDTPSDEPRFVANGDRAVHLVRAIDVAPTIASVVGLSIPDSWQGVPLSGDWSRRAPHDKLAFSETVIDGNQLSSLRSSTWKLVEDEPGGSRPLPTCELFELRHDPAEQVDLCTSVAASAVRERMREHLSVIRGRARGGMPGELRPLDPELCRQLQGLGYLEPGDDCGIR